MSTPANKDFVAISINDSSVCYSPSSKLYCNLCSCNLTLLDPQREEWFCTRCNVSYFPNKGEKVKRANKFETPGDEPNIIVSMVDDSPKSQDSMPKYFKEMERHGLKITSWEERA